MVQTVQENKADKIFYVDFKFINAACNSNMNKALASVLVNAEKAKTHTCGDSLCPSSRTGTLGRSLLGTAAGLWHY